MNCDPHTHARVRCRLVRCRPVRCRLHICSLAAAYAETGQFDRAIVIQREALAALLPSDDGLRAGLERRLQGYRQAQLWRE